VLDYAVTSNHIHLLVKDTSPNVIAQSMQLIAGRTAQEYNQRRAMQGAFWEDRYHATAIEIDEHLHRCVVYIDLNMVRAGVVNHPGQWNESGFCEIQEPPKRYSIIDLRAISELCGFGELADWVRQGGQTGVRHNKRILLKNPPMPSFACLVLAVGGGGRVYSGCPPSIRRFLQVRCRWQQPAAAAGSRSTGKTAFWRRMA